MLPERERWHGGFIGDIRQRRRCRVDDGDRRCRALKLTDQAAPRRFCDEHDLFRLRCLSWQSLAFDEHATSRDCFRRFMHEAGRRAAIGRSRQKRSRQWIVVDSRLRIGHSRQVKKRSCQWIGVDSRLRIGHSRQVKKRSCQWIGVDPRLRIGSQTTGRRPLGGRRGHQIHHIHHIHHIHCSEFGAAMVGSAYR